MKYGIVGSPVPEHYKYSDEVNRAVLVRDISPLFAYSIFWRESIRGEVVLGIWDAATVVSADGGHGLGQITPPNTIPPAWRDPFTNAVCSLELLNEAIEFWVLRGLWAESLIKVASAEYNAGRRAAARGHEEGDADEYTTGKDYGSYVVLCYTKLVNGEELN